MFNLLKYLLIKKKTILSEKMCDCIIQHHGFKREYKYFYVRDRSYGMTQIKIHNNGIWIKAYGSGYGESDFLKFPITKNQLEQFIFSNSV